MKVAVSGDGGDEAFGGYTRTSPTCWPTASGRRWRLRALAIQLLPSSSRKASSSHRLKQGYDIAVPATRGLALRRIWAATIDYTPDHLPILGPALTPDGARVEGVTVASAGGHGMMWGPGVARVAADLVTRGRTDVIDVAELGLDRFDAEGRSRLASDPIALPFPVAAD